jgi:hypothetical protein
MIIPEMLNKVQTRYLHRHWLGKGRITLNKVFLKLFEFSRQQKPWFIFCGKEAIDTLNVFNRSTLSKFFQI